MSMDDVHYGEYALVTREYYKKNNSIQDFPPTYYKQHRWAEYNLKKRQNYVDPERGCIHINFIGDEDEPPFESVWRYSKRKLLEFLLKYKCAGVMECCVMNEEDLINKESNMTKEQKKLLIEDLCGRLPYGVKCSNKTLSDKGAYNLEGFNGMRFIVDCPVYDEGDDEWLVESIVPYLRPMSSMTEEEDKEWQLYKNRIAESCDELLEKRVTELHDWFCKKHLDYRGLIDKGLALPAPEGMYNF